MTIKSSQKQWTLGLDIGSNSIGWMLLREPDNPETPVSAGDSGEAAIGEYVPDPVNPLAIGGVRVFPAGTADEKDIEKSKCADRRTARGARRQHDRRGRRKRRLNHVLYAAGMIPADPAALQAPLSLDPYELRARGLDEQLTPHEFGRAIIHLNQRRGFKSNRKTDSGKDTGVVKENIKELNEQMEAAGSRTLGEYLFRNVPLDSERRRDRYLHRDMIRHEFDLLWQKQRQFYAALLTDKYHDDIVETIFHQRPFDQGDHRVGNCEFEPSEKRARRGHRLAQQFRILQEIANIRIIEPGSDERSLTPEENTRLAAELDAKREFKLEKLPTFLSINPHTHINFSNGKRDKLSGNTAEIALRKTFKKRWENFTEDQRNDICTQLLEDDDETLQKTAREQWALDEEAADTLLKTPIPDKHGMVSLKAIQKMLHYLEQGHDLYEAKSLAGYDNPTAPQRVYDKLPLPPGAHFRPDVEKTMIEKGLLIPDAQEITNPVVRKALFEVRRVVNAIIHKYDKPAKIVVELARDTRGSIEQRNEQTCENHKRDKIRQQIGEELLKQGLQQVSRGDIIKYRLWKECREICPYSGQPISFEQLFIHGKVHVEHILPYSFTLDDSYLNKTLCFEDSNREKGNRSPYEAFHDQPERYQQMLDRVAKFASPERYLKLRKFQQKELNLGGCVDRQLNDTRYISRQVHEYLRLLGVPVQCTRGQVTAELRYCWGLNTILSDDGSNEKNRTDHRHHAIDAAVIALTTERHLQLLARREQFRKQREAFPEPWRNFRRDIETAVSHINVSHAPTRRVRGQLHEETNYGPTPKPDTYVYRKHLNTLTFAMVGDIRDKAIRDLVIERLKEHGMDDWQDRKGPIPNSVFPKDKPLSLPNNNGGPPTPVKKVRICINGSGFIPMKDPEGINYRYVKPGNNHHLVFFIREDNGRCIYEAFGVTLYEAARRCANKEPVICRKHPTCPDARFLMSLCKNDTVMLRNEQGIEHLYRVQKMSIINGRTNISFRSHTASGLKDDSTLFHLRTLSPPKFPPRKVTINLLGEIHPEQS
ncbi:MAG: type II CRISPR RNA-guided endonuclease Cas9 [bacterium]|nr:type II CRISPR RNA-guided endonuclease Cas9 [Candidatus Sumerlaeota bacterium]